MTSMAIPLITYPECDALRIGPNELHLSNPELYDVIYSQNHHFIKDDYYYSGFPSHTLFTETNREKHRERRKLLSRPFSTQTIVGMQSIMDRRADKLCDKISEVGLGGVVHLYQAAR